jgi:hypothetical protein
MKFPSITSIIEAYPKTFVHASNIKAKQQKANLSERQKRALPLIEEAYLKYVNAIDDIKGYSKEEIEQRVKLLNDYYDFIHDNDWENLFTSQSKFRSTILEEFLFILFNRLIGDLRDKINDENSTLMCGSSKSYTNMYFYAKNVKEFVKAPEIGINMKDQDFAIYRELSLKINDKSKKVLLPVVAIEAKTYLDKTMLEGSIATAEKIKSGNPYTKFYIVTETYEVDLNVDPAYSRIDQIHVLRKSNDRSENKPIYTDVIEMLVNVVREHLSNEWSNVEEKLTSKGIIL